MKSWIACVGMQVGSLFWGLCVLFSHARIGLLIEPVRETDKLIIVPLGWVYGI